MILQILFALIFFQNIQASERRPLNVNDKIICIYDIESMGSILDFHSWGIKTILDKLAGGEFLNEKEMKVLEQNPTLFIKLKSYADKAMNLSKKLCGATSDDFTGYGDEQDALRHFILSSLISYHHGEKVSLMFMSAHENMKYEKDNSMDYYNNDVGIKYGKNLKSSLSKLPTSKRRIKKRNILKSIEEKAIEYLDHGEFVVTRSIGDQYKCQRKDLYPNL